MSTGGYTSGLPSTAPGNARVSKQDDHFFNMFSIVLGTLVAIAIVLFAIARSIGTPFEEARAAADPAVAAGVAANTAPVGRLAVAGQDNSALAIKAPGSGAAPTALPVPKSGEETFQTVCSACHGTGIGGAPKVGDHAAWGPRIGQGKATLYEHALKGFTGKAGVMLAKGGRSDLPDDLVKETVDYMVKKSQ
jgi:cytochrome c5